MLYNMRCRWHGPNANKVASFGMDFETVSSAPSDLQDLVDTATAEWQSNVGLFSPDISLMPCTLQGFEREANQPPFTPKNPEGGFHRKPTTVQYVGAAAEVSGTVAGQSSPPQIALVVSLKTALPGRSYRGRCYTPPVPESVISGSGAVTDYVARATMVQDIAAAVEGALAPVDVDHVVYSLKNDTTEEVITYVADSTADTQRRRVPRV